MGDGHIVAIEAARLLPRGPVKGAADLDSSAPRLTIVEAGATDEPCITVSFTSSSHPERRFVTRFTETPFGNGPFSDSAPGVVAQNIVLSLLEDVESGTLGA